ncbi:hypothetical protein HanXRQr2_Chr04g0179731 [Helianthus annuus]|uniref:Uncharacterized protein n=1 Tax=Helianthus annuus TaxID=4232 RepID=A0A251V0H3_HELAN|nr:uncharacterized protein LOC110935114 [Helianthus annuus]KAF5811288.1 hypothetical protein HanXRQr2_Chr04g0179731 [Helianthus annuus]
MRTRKRRYGLEQEENSHCSSKNRNKLSPSDRILVSAMREKEKQRLFSIFGHPGALVIPSKNHVPEVVGSEVLIPFPFPFHVRTLKNKYLRLFLIWYFLEEWISMTLKKRKKL